MNEAALQAQLEQRIAQQFEILDKTVIEIRPDDLTHMVTKTLDPENMSPSEVAWLARLSVRKKVGEWLSRQLDIPTGKDVANKQLDAFSDELQDRYPVKRNINDKKTIVYVERDHITDIELMGIAARMDRVGAALHRHADNIRAYMQVRTGVPA